MKKLLVVGALVVSLFGATSAYAQQSQPQTCERAHLRQLELTFEFGAGQSFAYGNAIYDINYWIGTVSPGKNTPESLRGILRCATISANELQQEYATEKDPNIKSRLQLAAQLARRTANALVRAIIELQTR
jgi:hypothetical protein